MSRRRGRDEYRPRELRGVVGTYDPTPLVFNRHETLRSLRDTTPGGLTCRMHGVPWLVCERCSKPRAR